MKELKIDPELRDLLPPLTDDEYKQLEKNIVENGFDRNFPIMEWHGFIVDGHNRYSICKKHNIEYVIGTLGYDTKDEVMEWMLDIQLGRRNLSPIQRIAVAEKYRPIYEKQARKNLSKSGGDKKSEDFKKSSLPNLVNPISTIDTTKKLAEIAGVGKETYRMGAKVLNSDNEELKKEVLSGDKSISAAYKEITKPKVDNADEEESTIPPIITKPSQTKPEIDDNVRRICEDLKRPRTPEYLASIWDYKLDIIECMNGDFDRFFPAFVSTLSEVDEKVTQSQLDECIENAEKMVSQMENVILTVKNNTTLKGEN